MCGIIGSVTFGRGRPDSTALRKLNGMLSHRGPDEAGLYGDGECAFAISRLKIVGLENGSQPIVSKANGTVVVFNGEIYNYKALNKRILEAGIPIESNSDAQTISTLYGLFGLDFVDMLDGMFAIAIYDSPKKRLHLIRDKFGKKPLNYLVDGKGGVHFSSEIGPLKEMAGGKLTLNKGAIDIFLSYRIIPAPHTIYSEIRKVMPGHVYTFEAGRLREREYWKTAFPIGPESQASIDSLAEKIEKALLEAVKKRLDCEVPFGVMLSGGLDSSLIAAMAHKVAGERLKTFSVGFESKGYDESGYSRLMADYLGSDHYHKEIGNAEALETIPRMIAHFGEPFGFPSSIACHFMFELARKQVKVVLGGDGADEIFCGYNRYKIFRNLPPRGSGNSLRRGIDFSSLGGESDKADIAARYQSVLTDGLRASEKATLLEESFKKEIRDGGLGAESFLRERFSRNAHLECELMRAQDVDIGFWMRDAQLVKVDMSSMLNSVEARSPFLDQDLFGICKHLPAEYKLSGENEKLILKKIAAKYLPEEIVHRRKQELSVPMEEWAVEALASEIKSVLGSERSLGRGLFKPDALRAFAGSYGRHESYGIWTMYVLEKWLQTQVDGPSGTEGL